MLIRLLAVLLPILAPACAWCQAPATAPVQPLKFGDTVGVVGHFKHGAPAEGVEAMLDLRVKWVRDTELWRKIELEPGKYLIPADLARRLAFYKKHDIGVVFEMSYGNGTAYPADGSNAEAYGRYAAWMARYLEQLGVRYVLEIWNEPGNFSLGPKLGGHRSGSPPSPWVDKYLELVQAAVKAATAEVPQAKLIMGDDVVPAQYWMTEKGLPSGLAGFTIHPYIQKPTSGPETTHYGPDHSWNGPFKVVDEARSFRSMVQRLSDRYQKAIGHKPQIWATEWGYSLGKKLYTGGPLDEDVVAAFLPRMYIIAADAGVRATFWFYLQDTINGPYGLLSKEGHKRLTYDAFKTMTGYLGDATLLRQIAGKDHPNTGLQAYLFEAPMGYRVAAWNIEGPVQVAIQTGSSVPLRIVSNLDKPVQTRFLANGGQGVQMGIAPVYLIGGVEDDVTLEVVP